MFSILAILWICFNLWSTNPLNPPSLSALTLALANKGDLLATLKPEIHQPPKSPFAQRAALALANKGDLLATLVIPLSPYTFPLSP